MFGRLKPGDTITVNTSDSREVKGRFEAGRADVLILRVGDNELAFAWTEIERVRRPNTGLFLKRS